MTISGSVKSSLIDFPGLVSCVLFVPGCNYNCFYCHNRSLIDGTAEILSPEYVKDFLEKRAGLLDGVVLSGGEPTLQPDLKPYLGWIKSLGYKLKLDSNGSRPDVISGLLSENTCDYYAIDYKAPSLKYSEFCGERSDAKAVLETISILKNSGADFEVRTTVFPQLSKEDLITMAKELPALPRYVLNPYRMPEKYEESKKENVTAKPYTKNELAGLAEAIRPYQPNVRA